MICPNGLTDFLIAAAMGNELLAGRHINAIDIRKTHRGCGRGEDHALGARLTCHAHDLAAGRPANNGVIHNQYPLVLELGGHGIELLSHRLLAHLLAGHDEGAAHITILNKAFAIRHIQAHGQLHRRRPA